MKAHLNQIWFLSDQPTPRSAVYHDLPTVWHHALGLLVWHHHCHLCVQSKLSEKHTSHISLCLVSFMSDRATHLRLFDWQESGHCMKQSPGSLLSIWNLTLNNRHRHNLQSSLYLLNFVSSVRSSSGYDGLIEIRSSSSSSSSKATFSNISNSSDSKELKRPNICFIFEKHEIQRYQIWHSVYVKHTNTQIHKYKVLKRLNMCYIFLKHGIQGYQL